uniref:Uncharacterized protein n=1 Tax=Monodelphis domestica TaxID=13616 RepID=A0A5F8GZD0_MONDO
MLLLPSKCPCWEGCSGSPLELPRKEEEENEALPSSGLSSFRAETQPRVSFWIIKLPHRMGQVESQPGSGWLSEKRHRLQAIRDGLREGAHEEAPFRFHPRRAHFFYLLKPPRKL